MFSLLLYKPVMALLAETGFPVARNGMLKIKKSF
jgi:hypothetical protein